MKDNVKQQYFMELFEPCREKLNRFAFALAKDRQDANDIVQETILKAYGALDSLKNPEAFPSFLFTIASRIHKRTGWRQRLFTHFNVADDDSQPEIEGLEASESEPGMSHDVEMLYQALAKLPHKQKEAVVLFEISGLSIKEICEIQGGSVPGVKSRIQRGRKALAELLGVQDYAGSSARDDVGSRPTVQTRVTYARVSHD